MDPENIHERIEAYLSGELEGERLRQFEKEMQDNAVLAQEVALYRDMEQALRPSHEDALRANLALLDKRYAAAKPQKKSGRGWWIGVLIALAGFGAWEWWRTSRTEAPEAPVMEDNARQELQNTPPEAPGKENSGDLILPGTPDSRQMPPVAQDQSTQNKEDQAELLAANFEPNPQLEALVGNQVRGEEYRFRVSQPTANARLRPINGQTKLAASGLLETSVQEVTTPFRALLFSNKKEDYQNFKPVFSQNLAFEKAGDGFRFELDAQLRLPQGLYYFLIEDEDSGTLYYVTKVQIK